MLEKKYAQTLDMIEDEHPECFLDAIMMLSGSDDKEIRSTAFSSLSSLSEYSSLYQSVMAQIKRDISLPKNLGSRNASNYYSFIFERI